MRGRIYSDQKCPVCGGNFVHDDHRQGLFCLDHSKQQAAGRFRVQFGRGTRRRFETYREAERFLYGLRYEVDKGIYDPRDYRLSNPLGFEKLARKWLEIKEKEVRPGSFKNLKLYIGKAVIQWGASNIKSTGYGEIEDFLHNQNVSDKTKSNMKSCLHSFWVWVIKREKIAMPDFPVINYELGLRKIIDKKTQSEIINEVKEMTYKKNMKIWIGIKFYHYTFR
ncbi:MAG: hypothetical protein ABIL58_23100 [Pseudomonadota bacterium]